LKRIFLRIDRSLRSCTAVWCKFKSVYLTRGKRAFRFSNELGHKNVENGNGVHRFSVWRSTSKKKIGKFAHQFRPSLFY